MSENESGGERVALTLVLLVSLFLLLMIFAYELKKLIHFPVSPALLIFGIIIRTIGPHIGQISDVVSTISSIESMLISLCFFPILILAASVSSNAYTLRKEFFQILPLSTTVVLFCTILTGYSLKYIFGYDFLLKDLMMLGAILSATDHVSVAALLKDIYASEELETLIGGETMFNEAMVIVIFKVLLKHDVTGPSGVEEGLVLFCRLVFGGFAIGIGFSIAVSKILKRILNDFYVETNLVIIAAYLAFWICEMKEVEMSGAIALVTFGVYMAAYGKTFISPSIEERFFEIIEILERNVESILFVIAGVLFANSAGYADTELESKDYYVILLLFPLTYLIRFVVLLIHYPILKYCGYGLKWREFIVLGFSGMKGVIAVGLALEASQESELDPHFKALISYFGIGIAGLSILFGGLATRLSVRFLGLEELTEVQQAMLANVVKSLIETSDKKIEKLKNNKNLKLIKWDSVMELSGPTALVEGVLQTSKIGKEVLSQSQASSSYDLLQAYSNRFRIEKKEMQIEMRRRYLATLKKIYWENFSNGLCHGDASLLLIDCCSLCMDKDSEEMRDWEIVRNFLAQNGVINLFSKLSRIPLIGRFFRKSIYKRVILAYDVANNFIKAHEETEKLIDEMEIDVDRNIFEGIMKEAHNQVKKCEEYMSVYIVDCYPEILAEVQTKRCCKILLYSQRKMIEDIYEKKVIKEIEYEALMESIDSSIRIVTFQGIPSIPVIKDVFRNRFAGASPEEISKLTSLVKECVYKKGDQIFTENQPAYGAFLIIRGRIREHSSWIDQELIIGNIVGVQYLIKEFSSTYKSTATAITSIVVAHIPKEIIEIQGFVEEMYSEACEELILLNKSRYDLEEANEVHILRIINVSEVKSLRIGKKLAFMDGGLVLRGNVYEGLKGYFIKPSKKIREIKETCTVLILPKDFAFVYDKNKSLAVAVKNYCVKIVSSNIETKIAEVLDDESMIDEPILATSIEKSKSRKTTSVSPTKK